MDSGNLIIFDKIKTNSINGIDDTLNRIWSKLKEMIEQVKIDKKDILGVGIGIPGPVIEQSVVGFFANFSLGKKCKSKRKI